VGQPAKAAAVAGYYISQVIEWKIIERNGGDWPDREIPSDRHAREVNRTAAQGSVYRLPFRKAGSGPPHHG